jgi:polyisoprenoid-binding protein YceI
MSTTAAGNCRLRLYQTVSAALPFALLLLAGCQTAPLQEESAVLETPSGASVTYPAYSTDAPRFQVDPQASEIRLLVYRTGALARFGHNHVITGPMRGEIRAGAAMTAAGFRLEIPVESLAIDAPAARAEEGEDFAAEVSDQARQGTRENLLGSDLLDAAGHPLIRIDSLALSGSRSSPTVLARVALRGAVRDLRFRATVTQRGDLLTVLASFRVRQSDFGISPFSTLGGGLQVRDAIDIRIRLVARRG